SSLVLNDMLTIQYTGRMAKTRYSTRKTTRFLKRRSSMAGLLVGGADTLHPVVEDEAEQQDDQEVDQRERRRRAEVELADRLLRQVLAEEGRRVAGAATGEDERLGVDHEAVHEAQQHGDHQHAAQLGQLDVAEHRELGGAVD